MVGTIGPWVTALIITVTGLDAGNWGIAALTLGAISCVALLIELLWPRTPFNPRWAVPLAWAAAVAGVACLVYAVPFLIRIMTTPKISLASRLARGRVGIVAACILVCGAVRSRIDRGNANRSVR
jgi:hypothetical protein